MRNVFLAGVAFGALTTSVMAADMAPYYKAPPVAQGFNWSGFYLGADVGGAWSSVDANGFGASSSASGVIGGVYGGYNWQVAPQWLIGIEGDSSWTDLNGTIGFGKVNWLGSVRGRIGYTPTSTMLFYFTGGAAWSTIDNSGFGSFAGSTDQTKSGWVIGGGVEWAPWPSNWLIRAEYLNYNFTGVAVGPFSTDLTINEVRAGVAYKF
jgi:outer membrane immunogenic protein